LFGIGSQMANEGCLSKRCRMSGFRSVIGGFGVGSARVEVPADERRRELVGEDEREPGIGMPEHPSPLGGVVTPQHGLVACTRG
jgi:hypothetical protein